MSESNYPFRQANKYHAGRIDQIQYAVVHCTAGPESAKGTGAEAVQAMFARNTRDASAHVIADNNSIVRSVHDRDTAWAAKGFNANGLHLELVGMPTQSRAQWLDEVSRPTLQNGARVLADWSRRYGLRPHFLSLPDLKAGVRNGFTSHAMCEEAKPSSGHWDPGPNFPFDVLEQMVSKAMGTTVVPGKRLNPYMTPVDYSAPCGPGDVGNEVRYAQWALGIPVDGVYGKQTADAVLAANRRHNWRGGSTVGRQFIEAARTIQR